MYAQSAAPTPTPKRVEDMTDEEAINATDEVYKKKVEQAAKLLAQANALIAQGKDREAIPLLNQARELNSNDTRILAAGAIALLHLGDLANAEAAARAGVNSFFKSPEIFDALGQVQVAKKEFPAAIESFGKSLDIEDTNATVYYHRGIAKASSNDNAGALADYTKAIQLDPKLDDAYFKRGYLYIFVLDQPAKGIADLDSFLARYPNYSYAYSNRASGYFNLKQFDKSLADNTKAISLLDKNKFAFANRGLTYVQLGKYDLARTDYAKALELDPNFQLVKDRLADLDKQNAGSDAAKKADFDRALRATMDTPNVLTPEFAAEIKKGQQANLGDKNGLGTTIRGDRLKLAYDLKINGLLVESKLSTDAMGKFTAAELSSAASCTEMEHGYDINNQLNDLILKKRADAYGHWFDLTETETKDLETGISGQAKVLDTYRLQLKKSCGKTVSATTSADLPGETAERRIRWLNLHKRYNEALRSANEALAANPTDEAVLQQRAETYGFLRKFDLEKKDVDTLFTLSRAARNYMARADWERIQKMYPEAKADYEKALSLAPVDADIIASYGIFLILQNDQNGALAQYDRALSIDPQNAIALSNRPNLYLNYFARPADAVTDLNAAIKLMPSSEELYYNRGMAYYQLGKYDEALADFQKAFEIEPKYRDAISNVGVIFAKKGLLENAMYAYMQALNIDPDYEIAQNNLTGIVARIKTALASGALKFSKQGFTNYYTARSKVYGKIVTKSDMAANDELNRRSDTLHCSILLDAYKAHYRFDSFLRSLTDDYNLGNTTYSTEDVKLLPETIRVNKQNMSRWFDTMHNSGCIVYAFDPEFQ